MKSPSAQQLLRPGLSGWPQCRLKNSAQLGGSHLQPSNYIPKGKSMMCGPFLEIELLQSILQSAHWSCCRQFLHNIICISYQSPYFVSLTLSVHSTMSKLLTWRCTCLEHCAGDKNVSQRMWYWHAASHDAQVSLQLRASNLVAANSNDGTDTSNGQRRRNQVTETHTSTTHIWLQNQTQPCQTEQGNEIESRNHTSRESIVR